MIVKNAGIATTVSSHSISLTVDIIKQPTTTSAGAVAAEGMTAATGATNSAAANKIAVTMAAKPDRPPAATPAAAFDVTDNSRSAAQRTERRRGAVGEKDSADARDLALPAEQTGFVPNGEQRSHVVEQIHKPKDEHDFQESQAQRRANIELQERI